MPEFRVVIPTAHFDASARFYTEILGWPLVRSWPDPGRGAIFTTGGDTVIELLADDTARPVAGVFCSVEVPDVRARAGQFAAAGVAVTQPLAPQPWGHLSVAVTDPNGLLVVLFEPMT